MGRKSLRKLSSPSSSETAPKNTADAAAKTLAPGFRFHPSDEELVSYYLKRKIQNKPLCFDAIVEVDIYNHEPCDLSGFSKLKSRDQEWYFFISNKKYGTNGRKHRLTPNGHWKTTGNDKEIRSENEIQLLGMKKLLVYHTGRAPDGIRTNWGMNEYRLVEQETDKDGKNLLELDAYVLCKVFRKRDTGPSSGKIIYAAFNEEEWVDDDDNGMAMIPGFTVRVENGNNQIDQVDNNNHDHDEEKEEDESRPRPLPKFQYKRRRQNKSNNSSKTTQESSKTTLISSSSAAATNTELLEFSQLGISELPPSKEASCETLIRISLFRIT